MLALFIEIFLFILIAVVVGFIIGWLMRGRFGSRTVPVEDNGRLNELETENAEYQKIIGEYDALNERLEKDKLRLEAELNQAKDEGSKNNYSNFAAAGAGAAAGVAASSSDAFAREAEIENKIESSENNFVNDAVEDFKEELPEVKTETIDLEKEDSNFNLSDGFEEKFDDLEDEATKEVEEIKDIKSDFTDDLNEISAPTVSAYDPDLEYEIEEIEGIGKAFGNALREKGISTTADLLRFGGTSLEKREELSEHMNINISVINSWIGMADLLRIPAIDKQEAELLYDAGVLNVNYLKDFEAVVLVEKLDKLNDTSPIEQPVPTLEEAKSWIETSKSLEAQVN